MLKEQLAGYHLILASGSPRRQYLLKELQIDFDVWGNHDTDESYPGHLNEYEIPVYLAHKKAEAFMSDLQPADILITADTIVWCMGKVMGKPEDYMDAVQILKQLSGNRHDVITGVCLVNNKDIKNFYAVTSVHFKKLTDNEIDYYLKKFKPYDKAGAYGIQEWIGYIGIEKIEGSFYNVMGLPVQRLYEELLKYKPLTNYK